MITSLKFWFFVAIVLFISLNIYYYNYVQTIHQKDFYDLSAIFLSSFIISSIFYYLVVDLPLKKKRLIIKSNFKKSYAHFKKDMIRQILQCSKEGGRSDIKITEQLINDMMDVKKFRDLFKDGKESNEGYYAFCNHIQSHPSDFKEILIKFKAIERQLSFILYNYDIGKKKNFDSLKKLEATLFELNYVNIDDDIKGFTQLIWSIFAGWSFIDGGRKSDFIEDIINDI